MARPTQIEPSRERPETGSAWADRRPGGRHVVLGAPVDSSRARPAVSTHPGRLPLWPFRDYGPLPPGIESNRGEGDPIARGSGFLQPALARRSPGRAPRGVRSLCRTRSTAATRSCMAPTDRVGENWRRARSCALLPRAIAMVGCSKTRRIALAAASRSGSAHDPPGSHRYSFLGMGVRENGTCRLSRSILHFRAERMAGHNGPGSPWPSPAPARGPSPHSCAARQTGSPGRPPRERILCTSHGVSQHRDVAPARDRSTRPACSAG